MGIEWRDTDYIKRGLSSRQRAWRRRGGWIVGIAGGLALIVACSALILRSPLPVRYPSSLEGTRCTGDGPSVDICNDLPRMPGGDMVVAVDQGPAGWNAAAARGVTTAEQATPLLPSAFVFQPSGRITYNSDLLAAAPKVSGRDPVQVTYRIRDGAVWNDGTGRTHPVSGQDFVFAWRARDGHDPRLPVAATTGYELIYNVESGDRDRTVTVTFTQPYADWRGLFTRLEPYWFAAAATGADPADARGMTDPQLEKAFAALDKVPKFSAGPFMISDVDRGGVTVEVPNPRWYGASRPTLHTLTFRPVNVRGNLTSPMDHHANVFINAAPDKNFVETMGNIPGVDFQMAAGFTWEHLQLNTTDPFLRDPMLRRAVLTAIDVEDLIDQLLKPYFSDVKRLYGHNLLPDEPGYVDATRQVDPALGTDDVIAAGKMLAAAGYTGIGAPDGLFTPDGRHVTIVFAHTDTPTRDASAKLVVGYLARLGITVTNKVSRAMPTTLANHAFGIAEIDSANSPLLGTTARLWSTGGAENFTGWSDPRSDALLDQAAHEMDTTRQAALLNQQDRILTAADVDLPLYRQPMLTAWADQWVHIRSNFAGGQLTYNTQDWGQLRIAQ